MYYVKQNLKKQIAVSGWYSIQSSQDEIDMLYAQGRVVLPQDCPASVNEFVVLQAGSGSALCVRKGEYLEKIGADTRIMLLTNA